jgi:hypothetical protein
MKAAVPTAIALSTIAGSIAWLNMPGLVFAGGKIMARNRKGRPRKTAEQKLRDSLERNLPAEYILARRKLFSFVQPPAKDRLDGRNGEIDSEICDAIGQMCALGLFDGHGHDPIELRDKGRFWGCHYAKLLKRVGVKTGAYERASRSEATGALTAADLLFDRIDEALPNYERQVLLTLLVDPLIGHHETVPWAQSLIDEALLKRGKLVPHRVVRFPDSSDRAYLAAAVRGLLILIDGSIPARWVQAA